jgi:2-dehydro-3-deoxyphosphooctonate aldolase (KDO 8-P synthase)
MLFEQIRQKPFFILGPCVIENQDLLYTVAEKVAEIGQKYQVPVIFKSSFDKANRTSIKSYRGPGLEAGLEMLNNVKERYQLPLLTDIHESYQAAKAAEVVDVLQIPAYLCRQTDLLVAAAQTGKVVNVKKAQFLSGQDMFYPAQKVVDAGNPQVILTERGNVFGYNNLAVDFRNIYDMKKFGYPVCMDCTHSVQRPGGTNGTTGGDRTFVPMMALAAKAFGADGYFMEVHPDPDRALSDGPNMVKLQDLEGIIQSLID